MKVMKIGGNSSDLRNSGRAMAHRRVEKPNAPSSLPEKKAREAAPSVARIERRNAARASRFGTNYAGEADRRGTQVRFVAQVLGQILCSGRNTTLQATRAYAEGGRVGNEPRHVGML
jgi:hypothetical protein